MPTKRPTEEPADETQDVQETPTEIAEPAVQLPDTYEDKDGITRIARPLEDKNWTPPPLEPDPAEVERLAALQGETDQSESDQ